MNAATPMMAQYIEIKAANPDSLLFYRMGDFYELFFDDAEVAARALGIALTKRGKHQGADIPMCGVPVHAADDYLQKLIRLGHRVAVCEQLEDPAEAKKRGSKSVVRRDVVRLVTPGTITEDKLLEAGRANVLCALAMAKGADPVERFAIAAIDISTGTFKVCTSVQSAIGAELARLAPSELVLPQMLFEDEMLRVTLDDLSAAIQPQPDAMFTSSEAENHLKRFFDVASLDGFAQFSRAELAAASGALSYIEHTQIEARPILNPPEREISGGTMFIDAATRANLELTRTLSGETAGSLLHAIDRTVTGGGARLLSERLRSPLTDTGRIADRQDEIAFFLKEDRLREDLTGILKRASDIPRALSRISLGRAGPRDLKSIAAALNCTARIAELCAELDSDAPKNVRRDLSAFAALPEALLGDLDAALADDVPMLARDGGFVRTGYDEALDEQRDLASASRSVIAGLQSQYCEKTGVKSLKIRHNNMLGYFIEVTSQHADGLLADKETFIHRQTMANAMRFTTTELSDLESHIANAAGQALALEQAHFERLCGAVLEEAPRLQGIAAALARTDCAMALAKLAQEQGYCRPLVDESRDFSVVAGRHPVVEQALRKQKAHPFVANDCRLNEESGWLWLLTGPNMGGKSTFLRQNALIAILAQMGCFVPAGSATIGTVDRLFSRVGAADDLARGRSTFMVEMIETAAILNQAGARSLVILDEIGRGTATYDGLSIAWATVEHLHEENRCRTLFATHFHELTALSGKLDHLANVTMKVREWNGDVVFLHEVGEGVADRSYGLQVARLAGLPKAVTERARIVLDQLEARARESGDVPLVDDLPLFSVKTALAEPAKASQVEECLKSVNPDTLAPRDALDLLYELRAMVAGQ